MVRLHVEPENIQPGDIVKSALIGGRIEVERPSPDVNFIYRTNWSSNAEYGIIFAENGLGYWHAYKQIGSVGLIWSEFAEKYNILSPTDYTAIGTLNGAAAIWELGITPTELPTKQYAIVGPTKETRDKGLEYYPYILVGDEWWLVGNGETMNETKSVVYGFLNGLHGDAPFEIIFPGVD